MQKKKRNRAEHYLKMSSDAISLLESATEKNSIASYQLGRLYLFGTDGIERDVQQAVQKIL